MLEGGVYRFFGMMNGYPALECFGLARRWDVILGELVGYIDGRTSAR